jgi:hypothetical protein
MKRKRALEEMEKTSARRDEHTIQRQTNEYCFIRKANAET